jgi:hypothetical protein
VWALEYLLNPIGRIGVLQTTKASSLHLKPPLLHGWLLLCNVIFHPDNSPGQFTRQFTGQFHLDSFIRLVYPDGSSGTYITADHWKYEVSAFNIMMSYRLSRIADNDWPIYYCRQSIFKGANKYQRFQVGITGCSCLKHADTTDRGLIDKGPYASRCSIASSFKELQPVSPAWNRRITNRNRPYH